MHDVANLLSDLVVARDTNRRLNRRLGDAESSLNRLVSLAQNETAEAQKRVSDAQKDAHLWGRWYAGERERVISQERFISVLICLEVFFAGWAFAATAIAYRYWLRS